MLELLARVLIVIGLTLLARATQKVVQSAIESRFSIV